MADETILPFGNAANVLQQAPRSPRTVMQMLRSDLSTVQSYPVPGAAEAPFSVFGHPPLPICTPEHAAPEGRMPFIADLRETTDFARSSPANAVVPDDRGEAPEETAEGTAESSPWKIKEPTVGVKSSSGGVGESWTRENGTTTHEVDNRFGGKFEPREITLLSGEGKWSEEASVGKRAFGDAQSMVSGSANFVGAGAEASAIGSFGSSGLKAKAGANAEAYLLKGKVASNPRELVSGEASGSAVSVKAEAEGEVVLTAEQMTLSGKFGAEANLAGFELRGEACATPYRAARVLTALYNHFGRKNVELLSEDYDWGICASVNLGGSVGAQAGLEGKAEARNGDWTLGGKAKLGAGVGASAGGAIRSTGAAKLMDHASRLGRFGVEQAGHARDWIIDNF